MSLKQVVRGGLEQIVGRYGYTIADRGNMDRAAWQYFMTSLLDCISVDLVIDVGANEGQFRRSARQDLGYGGAEFPSSRCPRISRDWFLLVLVIRVGKRVSWPWGPNPVDLHST